MYSYIFKQYSRYKIFRAPFRLIWLFVFLCLNRRLCCFDRTLLRSVDSSPVCSARHSSSVCPWYYLYFYSRTHVRIIVTKFATSLMNVYRLKKYKYCSTLVVPVSKCRYKQTKINKKYLYLSFLLYLLYMIYYKLQYESEQRHDNSPF